MKYNEEFGKFLAALGKRTGETAVCEAAHAGYRACCEAISDDDLMQPTKTRLSHGNDVYTLEFIYPGDAGIQSDEYSIPLRLGDIHGKVLDVAGA